MNTTRLIVAYTVAAALAVPLVAGAQPAPKPKFDAERLREQKQSGKKKDATPGTDVPKKVDTRHQSVSGKAKGTFDIFDIVGTDLEDPLDTADHVKSLRTGSTDPN